MSKITIKLTGFLQKNYAHQCIDNAPDDFVCIIKKKTRSIEQNALMWSHLNDVAAQVEWYGRRLSPEDWKAVFTASLHKMDTVPGIDGGVVVLGQSTSRMTVSQLNDLIELIRAFGVDHNVRWTI